VDGPDSPEYADFHALRHTYLTMLGRHGVDLRTAQELAGHSTPLLTARYSHRRLYDLAGAVDRLPNLVPETPTDAAGVPLRLTGTGGAGVPGVPPGVPTGYAEPHQAALMYTFDIVGGTSEFSPKTLEIQGAGVSLHRPASLRTELPGQDLNLNKENQNPFHTVHAYPDVCENTLKTAASVHQRPHESALLATVWLQRRAPLVDPGRRGIYRRAYMTRPAPRATPAAPLARSHAKYPADSRTAPGSATCQPRDTRQTSRGQASEAAPPRTSSTPAAN